jgi:hypothetical protein
MLIHTAGPNSRGGIEQDFEAILFGYREPNSNIYLLR